MNEQWINRTYELPESQRLDKFLVECFPDFSRSQIKLMIKDGGVQVNGIPIYKAGFKLAGTVDLDVLLPVQESGRIIPEAIPLDIVFENQDLVVINKPAGMVVHPSYGHNTGTLVHAVLAHVPEILGVGGEDRSGVVHRLDKETSGLILMAKNEDSLQWLQRQFRKRKVDKTYLALVDGKPPTPTGRIESGMGRNLNNRNLMSVLPADQGKFAVTEYKLLQSFEKHSLLEVYPKTGRTHQIRVHMQYIGCPVTGDKMYGTKKPTLPINRHFLHANRLGIRLPKEKEISLFTAPLPGELEGILANLTSFQQRE